MTLGVTQRGWQTAITLYVIAVGLGVMLAYFRTSYLKVGGRIYSFWIDRTNPDPPADGSPAPLVIPPPDSYRGKVTADAQWWLMAVISVVTGVGAFVLGMSVATLGAAGLLVVFFALIGYIDHVDGFPIARGRWLQVTIVVVASIPMFMLPTIAYVIAYYIDTPRRTTEEANHDR